MRALKISDLSQNAIRELDCLYRTTRDAQLRTRVHMVLLAVEKGLIAAEIADIVRTDEQTVRRWLKRYQSQGLDGLYESPRPGCPRKVTAAYLSELMEVVRHQPNHLPTAIHLVDPRPAGRLHGAKDRHRSEPRDRASAFAGGRDHPARRMPRITPHSIPAKKTPQPRKSHGSAPPIPKSAPLNIYQQNKSN